MYRELIKTALNDAATKIRMPKVHLGDIGYSTIKDTKGDMRAILEAHKAVLGEEIAAFKANQTTTPGLRKARYQRADAIRRFMRPPDKTRVDMLGNYTDEMRGASGEILKDVIHTQDPYLGARKVHAIRSMLMRENKAHNKLMYGVTQDGRTYSRFTDDGLDAYLEDQVRLMDNVTGIKNGYYFGERGNKTTMPFFLGKDIGDFMAASAHQRQGSSFIIPEKLINKDYEYNLKHMYNKAYNGNDNMDPKKFSTRKGFVNALNYYIEDPGNAYARPRILGTNGIVFKHNKKGKRTNHDKNGHLLYVKNTDGKLEKDYILDKNGNPEYYQSYGFDYHHDNKRDLKPYSDPVDMIAPDRKFGKTNIKSDIYKPWMSAEYNERNFNPYRNY